MLSRPTVGAGAVLAVALSGLIIVMADRGRRSLGLRLIGGATGAIATFCLMSYLKFGTFVNPPYEHHASFLAHPERLAAMLENGGTNGLRYIPTNLVQYLRPDTLHFISDAPFVTFRMTDHEPVLNIGHVYFDGFEYPTSVTAVTPLLTVLAVSGTVVAVRRRTYLLIPIAASLAAILLTCSFFGSSLRYLPICPLVGRRLLRRNRGGVALGLPSLGTSGRHHRHRRCRGCRLVGLGRGLARAALPGDPHRLSASVEAGA